MPLSPLCDQRVQDEYTPLLLIQILIRREYKLCGGRTATSEKFSHPTILSGEGINASDGHQLVNFKKWEKLTWREGSSQESPLQEDQGRLGTQRQTLKRISSEATPQRPPDDQVPLSRQVPLPRHSLPSDYLHLIWLDHFSSYSLNQKRPSV